MKNAVPRQHGFTALLRLGLDLGPSVSRGCPEPHLRHPRGVRGAYSSFPRGFTRRSPSEQCFPLHSEPNVV